MTFLEIIQTVANELGLVAPTTLAAATDPQTIQMMALANRECTQSYRDYDWTDLQKEFIVNIADTITATGDVVVNDATVTNIPSTAGLSNEWAVSGNGMPAAQRVAEVLSATSIRLEMLPTASEVGQELVFAKDTYDLPEDMDRFISKTWWDRTNHWQLMGPDSPQMYQYIRSGIFTTGPRRRWTQIGRRPAAWRIWPPPFSGGAPPPGALVFMYISKNWCEKVDGSFTDKMTANDDVPLIDPQLVILGTKWRFWQVKGFEYASMQQEYLDAVSAKFGSDGGIPDLYLNRRSGPFLITNGNVPDGNWPGPGST